MKLSFFQVIFLISLCLILFFSNSSILNKFFINLRSLIRILIKHNITRK